MMIIDRANGVCEVCSTQTSLTEHTMEPASEGSLDYSLALCDTCLDKSSSPGSDSNYWRLLSTSMWSEHKAVQIFSWRMLKNLNSEGWAQDLFDQIYLEGDELDFASALDSIVRPKDSNGADLSTGDSVTLIKDLVVKGANFTAKRGTLVKNISLTSNPLHIEGKVNGTQIVLVSAYLKKVIN